MNSFIPEERDDYCDDESISVIIAAYNAEEFLPQAIESILRQTFTKFELIIVNDGSSDRTQEIIEDYMRQDSRIILINSPHFGTSSARNLGIHAAQYSWIANWYNTASTKQVRRLKSFSHSNFTPDVPMNNLSIGFGDIQN